jgi:hypothetical protein
MGRVLGNNAYMHHALCNREESGSHLQFSMFVVCYMVLVLLCLHSFRIYVTARGRLAKQNDRIAYKESQQTNRTYTKTYKKSVVEPIVELCEWRAPM